MNLFSSKKILITGATGFVGSHLVEELTKQKANILATTHHTIDPKSFFNTRGLDKKSKVVKIDLCHFANVQRLIANFKPDYIFHLAAQPLVEKAYVDPKTTLYSNILGTINVLESARIYNSHSGKSRFNRDASRIRMGSWTNQDDGIKGIIVASSDKAYGKLYRFPKLDQLVKLDKFKYKESHPLVGDHPYEVSKSSADLISYTYYKTYNLPVIMTRFGNIYGEGDIHFSRLVPGIMKALVSKEVFKIRSNGKFVRDYLYVKDVVRGYIMLAENIDKSKGEAFNFGSDETYSVLQLISQISQISQIRINYRILNTTKNEIPYQSLDWSKIRNTLGWKPEYNLEGTIRRIYEWYKSYLSD